jgi:hypothetical protein
LRIAIDGDDRAAEREKMADDPKPNPGSAARDDARARMIRKLGPTHRR